MQNKPDFARVPARALQFRSGEAVELSAAEEGKKTRPFSMRLYSGDIIKHWWFGSLILDIETMRFAKKVIPALRLHDVDRPVGMTREMEKSNGVRVTGDLMLSRADTQDLVDLMGQGFPMEASGYFVPGKIESVLEGSSATVNGRSVSGPAQVWRDVRIKEASFVPFGADENTEASLAAGGEPTVDLAAVIEEPKKMAEEIKTAPDPEALKAEFQKGFVAGKTAGVDEAKNSLKAILEAMKDYPQFAMEQFIAGADVKGAKAALADKVMGENAELQKQLAAEKNKQQAAGFRASDGEGAGKPPPVPQTTDGWKAEWAASAELQKDYRTAEIYAAYRKHEGDIHVLESDRTVRVERPAK